MLGVERYPKARRLMITADAGGSNGYRNRLWKVELGRLASETGLTITVCHYPPGTSKWNKIEHRLFSFITKNWRGRPLTSYRTVVELIAATTTESGLKVLAEWDQGSYPTGTRVTDADLAAVPIKRHKWHGDWNYDIRPAKSTRQLIMRCALRAQLERTWRHHDSVRGSRSRQVRPPISLYRWISLG